MGTQSLIGVMHGDKLKAVTAHWDGYHAYMGKILFENYDSAKANHLVSLGDISSVKARVEPDPGERHTFDDPAPNVTIAYHRDRGEDFSGWQVFDSFEEVLEYGETYVYIMRDGVWYTVYEGQLVTLESVLRKLKII